MPNKPPKEGGAKDITGFLFILGLILLLVANFSLALTVLSTNQRLQALEISLGCEETCVLDEGEKQ